MSLRGGYTERFEAVGPAVGADANNVVPVPQLEVDGKPADTIDRIRPLAASGRGVPYLQMMRALVDPSGALVVGRPGPDREHHALPEPKASAAIS